MRTEEKKIEIIKKKSEKELLESIAYDVDAIRGYVRVIGIVFLFNVALGFFIGIGLLFSLGK